MNKLNLIGISSILLANAAFAGSVNPPAYAHAKPKHPHAHPAAAFTGFSLIGGVGGVGMNLELDQEVDFSVSDGLANSLLSSDQDGFARDVAGMLGVGYGYQTRSGVFMGIYATAGTNYTDFESSLLSETTEYDGGSLEIFSIQSSNLRIKLENDFALLFKPGFVMNNRTLLYALVGPRWGNFNATLSAITGGAQVENFFGTTFDGRDHWNEYELGITAGAGITQAMSEHFQVGIEYAFTSYGDLDSLTVNESLEGEEGPGEMIAHTPIEANTNTLLATFAYKF